MKNIIDEKSLDFAVKIIQLSKRLEQSKDFAIARQILKSGTSIGANIREAKSAESKKDFIHKLSISLKEVRETEYWIELLLKSHLIESTIATKLSKDAFELRKILTSIIVTTKKKYLET